jgi:hypothetical protein
LVQFFVVQFVLAEFIQFLFIYVQQRKFVIFAQFLVFKFQFRQLRIQQF